MALTCDGVVVAVAGDPTEPDAAFVWVWQLQVSGRIWAVFEQTRRHWANVLYKCWNEDYFKGDHTHHHQAGRGGLVFQLSLDQAGIIAAVCWVCIADDKVWFVHGDSGNCTQVDQFKVKLIRMISWLIIELMIPPPAEGDGLCAFLPGRCDGSGDVRFYRTLQAHISSTDYFKVRWSCDDYSGFWEKRILKLLSSAKICAQL